MIIIIDSKILKKIWSQKKYTYIISINGKAKCKNYCIKFVYDIDLSNKKRQEKDNSDFYSNYKMWSVIFCSS